MIEDVVFFREDFPAICYSAFESNLFFRLKQGRRSHFSYNLKLRIQKVRSSERQADLSSTSPEERELIERANRGRVKKTAPGKNKKTGKSRKGGKRSLLETKESVF